MGYFRSLEDARAYFRNDHFCTENGIVLESLDDEGAVCRLELEDRHRNALGGVMGGAIFTLADLAFSAAANDRHHPTVALQVSINFLAGTGGSALYATARCVKDGRTSCVYNIDIRDDLGKPVAQAVGTGFKL